MSDIAPRPKYRKALRRVIFEDFMWGTGMREVARKWGVSEDYVNDAIRDLGKRRR